MLPSTKAFIDRQGRMLDLLSSKMNQTIGSRADMHIEDSEAIDNDSCRIMVAYANHIGQVTADQLEEFVIREFGGKLIPNMATAQNFSELGRVMVVVSRANVTRPLEDAEHMHKVVAGAVYMDTTLGDTWEVMQSADGSYLQRVSSDNIHQIVSERRRRMGIAGQQPVTIATAMASYGGTLEVAPGDTVSVLYKNANHTNCTVASVGDSTVTVRIPNVGVATVSNKAVYQIEAMSPARISEMERKLNDYYKQVYGPEYAKMLTRKTTQG